MQEEKRKKSLKYVEQIVLIIYRILWLKKLIVQVSSKEWWMRWRAFVWERTKDITNNEREAGFLLGKQPSVAIFVLTTMPAFVYFGHLGASQRTVTKSVVILQATYSFHPESKSNQQNSVLHRMTWN